VFLSCLRHGSTVCTIRFQLYFGGSSPKQPALSLVSTFVFGCVPDNDVDDDDNDDDDNDDNDNDNN
jgi:hypothetical protein